MADDETAVEPGPCPATWPGDNTLTCQIDAPHDGQQHQVTYVDDDGNEQTLSW